MKVSAPLQTTPNRTPRRHRATRALALTAAIAAAPAGALAQSATPGATNIEEIRVTAPNNVLQQRIEALPGGAALVSTKTLPSTANQTMSRALVMVPGIVVQDFFGGNDQPRIQIRGSGLQQNPVERGALILQDGLPIDRADGSYVVGFANPTHAQGIEVYRGYLANRLGATVLGGAINLISPTGHSAPGGRLQLNGGSFGQFGAHGQYGFAGDRYDALIQADISRRDGFRDQNDSRRISVAGNVGVKLSDKVSIRFFAGYSDLKFDIPGPLTADLLKSDPKSVFGGPSVTPTGVINPGPNALRDQPWRDAEQVLVGTRATGTFGAHIVDLALGYSRTEDSLMLPISAGLRETDGDDVTGVLRYAYKPDSDSLLPLFELTAQIVSGSADRSYYLNQAGTAGAAFGTNDLDAETLSVTAGFHIPLGSVTISPSISYARATRDNTDVYGQPVRPTAAYNPMIPTMALPNGAVPTASTSYDRTYDAWSPALGLSWRPNDQHLLFAAVSRSFEPPTHDDLLATANGTPNSSAGRPNPGNPMQTAPVFITPDLEAQRATTVEAGWRGQAGSLSWDLVAYYSWVKNELLSLRDETGAPVGAINAGRTRHFGIELGLTAQLTEALTGQLTYNYQDFRFHNDPVRGNNRLGGAPRHMLFALLDYRITERWTVQASVKWMIERTPVDNLNTLYNRPYAVVDLHSAYRISDSLSVFVEVTNLFDETYASSTLVVDVARADQAVFLPGDGRGFFGGVTLDF